MLGIGIYRLMKKITFIHISDVLLGALPDRECVWSGERKNEIYMTFEAVVARAGELDVDFLLVAGNLFDHQPSEEELAWLDEIFGSLSIQWSYMLLDFRIIWEVMRRFLTMVSNPVCV